MSFLDRLGLIFFRMKTLQMRLANVTRIAKTPPWTQTPETTQMPRRRTAKTARKEPGKVKMHRVKARSRVVTGVRERTELPHKVRCLEMVSDLTPTRPVSTA